MSSGIVETGIASAGGSVIAYFLLRLWKNIRSNIKVRGLICPVGKDELQRFNDANHLFIDIEKKLGSEYQTKTQNEKRLEYYPKAKLYLRQLKDNFNNMTIIIMSDDLELLKYLGVKNKHTYCSLPSEIFLSKNPNPSIELLKVKLNNATKQKNNRVFDSLETHTNSIRELFNLNCI